MTSGSGAPTDGDRSPGALALVTQVLDAGTWSSWDEPLPLNGLIAPPYAAALTRARERTGVDEAIITGEGTLSGRRLAVVASEFGFLGGSIGVAAAERLVHAVRRATRERLPLLAAPASGGTRMQEGTRAFVQMVPVSAALSDHRAAGLPYLVYLRDPTAGGVLASWGSLGHVTAAEPGAFVGLLGPRVQVGLVGRALPDGVQVAENLSRHGIVDAVLVPSELRGFAVRILDVLCDHRPAVTLADPGLHETVPLSAPWLSIQRSRSARRPRARALLDAAAAEVTFLQGTGDPAHSSGMLLALARFGGERCLVIGHDRDSVGRGIVQPAGLHLARNGISMAVELRLPLVALVDTPGVEVSAEAEESGLSAELAACLADFVTARAPSISVLLGEGAGAGALALLPADRIVAAQHSWLAALSPEGASVILHRTLQRAPSLAAAQRITAADLHHAGLIDLIIPERPDAAEEPVNFLRRVASVVAHELAVMRNRDGPSSAETRLRRYQVEQ